MRNEELDPWPNSAFDAHWRSKQDRIERRERNQMRVACTLFTVAGILIGWLIRGMFL